eukprot:gene4156-5679_t
MRLLCSAVNKSLLTHFRLYFLLQYCILCLTFTLKPLQLLGRNRFTSHTFLKDSEVFESKSEPEFSDYVVIGSGIGGLSCAALLSYYGYSVTVLESHYLPGGVAHTFEKDGFKFDAGPSLWNGMATKPYNPLREVLEIIDEGASLKFSHYDGWVMHTPDGSFKFTVGENKFESILQQFGGENALSEWKQLNELLEPIKALAGAVPPLTLRSDPGVILTLWPHLGKLAQGAGVASKVEGSFKAISSTVVKDKFLENWFEFLSFALSGLPADGTIAAA